MHLTQFSDYALRVGLYLACHGGKWVPVEEIARSYDISRNHLAKVVQRLVEVGVVETTRGRRGGLRLAKPAREVNLGHLIRSCEPGFDLTECFDEAANRCPVAGVCRMKAMLNRALAAFFAELDKHTLDEVVSDPDAARSAWSALLTLSVRPVVPA